MFLFFHSMADEVKQRFKAHLFGDLSDEEEGHQSPRDSDDERAFDEAKFSEGVSLLLGLESDITQLGKSPPCGTSVDCTPSKAGTSSVPLPTLGPGSLSGPGTSTVQPVGRPDKVPHMIVWIPVTREVGAATGHACRSPNGVFVDSLI